MEVKLDRKFRKTKNFYIEVAEKAEPRPGPMVPSGIFRRDNTILWTQGDFKGLAILSKHQLVSIYQTGLVEVVETPTSRAFLLPMKAVPGMALAMYQVLNGRLELIPRNGDHERTAAQFLGTLGLTFKRQF
jgi:hypothetical protein